jgi:hypothetical protein
MSSDGFVLSTDDGVSKLEASVRSKLAGRMRDFRLVIADRGLILRGWAPTYYVKQIAQHAILESTELPVLANEIEVS